MKYFTVQLAAPNDLNGNPRRVFVTYTTDLTQELVGVYDEGYLGAAAIRNRWHEKAYTGLRFNITLAEYRDFLRLAAEKGGS